MGSDLSADCGRKNMKFLTLFVVISRIEKRHRPKPMACSGRVIQVSCLLSKMMGNGIIIKKLIAVLASK